MPQLTQFEIWFFVGLIIFAIFVVTLAVISLSSIAGLRATLRLLEQEKLARDEIAPELRMQYEKWKADDQTASGEDEAAIAVRIKKALHDRKINGR